MTASGSEAPEAFRQAVPAISDARAVTERARVLEALRARKVMMRPVGGCEAAAVPWSAVLEVLGEPEGG